MKFLRRREEGCCPYCGSENIEFGTAELNDDTYDYDCTCNDCGGDFIQCYSLHFDGHYVYEDLLDKSLEEIKL